MPLSSWFSYQGTASAVPQLTPINKALAAEGLSHSINSPHLRNEQLKTNN